MYTRWNWSASNREATYKSRFNAFRLVFTLKSNVTSKCDWYTRRRYTRKDIFQNTLSYTHETFRLPSSLSLPFSLSLSLSLSLSFFLSLFFHMPDITRIYLLMRDFECNVMSFFSESAYAPTHVSHCNPTCRYQSKSMRPDGTAAS